MKVLRFLLVVAYVGYLVHVGLAFLLLPWSQAWPLLVVRMPPAAATILDAPAVRGALSGLGALHLLLLAAELLVPRRLETAP